MACDALSRHPHPASSRRSTASYAHDARVTLGPALTYTQASRAPRAAPVVEVGAAGAYGPMPAPEARRRGVAAQLARANQRLGA